MQEMIFVCRLVRHLPFWQEMPPQLARLALGQWQVSQVVRVRQHLLPMPIKIMPLLVI